MEVSSASSNTNVAAGAAAKKQLTAQKPDANQQAQKAASDRAREATAQSTKAVVEKNKPSVNTSGQTVGSRINTTA
jgi:hypothetical protein